MGRLRGVAQATARVLGLVLLSTALTPVVWAQTIQKITLNKSMASSVSPIEGDPTKLVDEQDLAGDPLNAKGGIPVTNWNPIYGAKVMRARIDLGKTYVITKIYLYDTNGKGDATSTYKVDARVGATLQNLVSDPLASYKVWKAFNVSATTSVLEVETPGYLGMPEIVIYGYESVNHAPVLNAIANQSIPAGDSVTLNLSATDSDYDAIKIEANAALPSYAKLTDNGNGTATLTLKPVASDVGVKTLSIKASDSNGLSVTRSFTVTVTSVTATTGTQVERRLGTTEAKMGYLEYLPADVDTAPVPYPIILFFHGVGERGNGTTELVNVAKNGPPKMAKNGKKFPAIVLSPQLPASKGGWPTDMMTDFLNYAIKTYRHDSRRVYATGLSLGGGGAWVIARDNPSLIAATVPVCGYASVTGYDSLKGIMPVWAFHHEVDPTVAYGLTTGKLKQITGIDPEKTRPQDNAYPGYTASFDGTKWVWALGEAAPAATQNPILTTYEGKTHNSWDQAYANEAMWTWLYKQSK